MTPDQQKLAMDCAKAVSKSIGPFECELTNEKFAKVILSTYAPVFAEMEGRIKAAEKCINRLSRCMCPDSENYHCRCCAEAIEEYQTLTQKET